MVVQNTEESVLCKISEFRYLSNVNGLSLLDGTYLESLITFLLKNKNCICLEGVIDLKEIVPVFQIQTVEGVKDIFERLYDLKALILYKKFGKYHQHHYIFSVNMDYVKYFYKE